MCGHAWMTVMTAVDLCCQLRGRASRKRLSLADAWSLPSHIQVRSLHEGTKSNVSDLDPSITVNQCARLTRHMFTY
jgi:hypothetical protein